MDANKIQKYFCLNNHEIVNDPKNADIIIFITCAVLNKATEQALKQIKIFKKYNAELIVGGCVPEIDKEKLQEVFNGRCLSTKNIEKLDEFFPGHKIKFSEIDDINFLYQNYNKKNIRDIFRNIINKIGFVDNIYYTYKINFAKFISGEYSIVSRSFQKYYCIRISWGCSGNCAYCGIKNAIGRIHSKPLEKCITEFKRGLEKSYKNFLITADDIGAYGLDIDSSFSELLNQLIKIDGDYKIHIQNLDPKWVVKYIDDLERIIKTEKIVSMGISVQSGNSRILSLMNRYSNVENIKKSISRIKKAYPKIVISTAIIIGFPTETHEEFEDTLKLIKEIDFWDGFVFRFSLKHGSQAEKIDPKVPKEEAIERFIESEKFFKKMNYNIKIESKFESYIFCKKK